MPQFKFNTISRTDIEISLGGSQMLYAIDYDGPKNLIITGCAGSGKTTVSLMRAERLFNITEQDTKAYFKNVSKKHTANNIIERFRYKRNFENKILPNSKNYMLKLFEEENISRGITCFSETSKNLLMWAHYAENHSGICLGYDTLKLRALLKLHNPESAYFKVNYVNKIEPKEYFAEREIAIDYWLTTKHKMWEYEQEVRLISRNFNFIEQKKYLLKVTDDIINNIVLGSAIDDDSKIYILNHVKTNLPHVKVYQITPNYDNFDLELNDLL